MAAALVAAGCGSGPEPAAEPPAAGVTRVVLDEAAARQAGVVVEVVETADYHRQIDAPATLALDETRTARVGSIVEGNVGRVFVQVGDRVEAGAVLAELDSHALHDAAAEYRTAMADERRRRTELEYARQARARAERLYAAKALPLQAVERATVDLEAAQEQLNMAVAELRRAERDLEHLGVRPGPDVQRDPSVRIRVSSPVSGVVLDRQVTPGTAVTPGTPMFIVSDLSELWVVGEVDESNLDGLATGSRVDVQVSAYPAEVFRASLTFVGDTLNPRTRRVSVRASLPNPDGRLKPEMFATIRIQDPRTESVVVVPSGAVQEIEGLPVVFVADGRGGYRVREVTLDAGPLEGRVPVRAGLLAGERIVTAGSFLLKSELLAGPEG